jgi:hypothetical protein
MADRSKFALHQCGEANLKIPNSVDDISNGLRAAHQLIDKIDELIGLPFRPKWAQPMFDGLEQVQEWRSLMAAQQRENDHLIALLESVHAPHPQPEICPACIALGRNS